MIQFEQWEGFEGRIWKEEVNVRDFIQKNYTPYNGDESFLAGPTEATDKLWGALQQLQKAERAKGGVLDMETEVVSSLTSYGPGYIDDNLKDLEQIVGLQTDKPLKRAFMPYGGIKMAEQACTTYGYDISQPAKDAKEACQWLYFGYLAAIKTQNGAAMSVGRISTFLDIYIQRDLDKGILTESEAQELIDHMVMLSLIHI